jgi:surfeit locus 1 family protein
MTKMMNNLVIICYTPAIVISGLAISRTIHNMMTCTSLNLFSRCFTSKAVITLIALVVFSFFVRLGFWQIQRAHEKQTMLAAEERLSKQEAVRWSAGEKLPLQYQRMQVNGHYLPARFLLDNQHHQHQFGYDIVSPLILSDGGIIMVDRGWIAGDPARHIFPDVPVPEGELTVSGSAYFPAKNQWVLGQAWEKKSKEITIIEILDEKLLKQILQKNVYPFIIRLGKNEDNGFIREWPIVAMLPERHFAYALQWFAMAGAILILFIVLNVRKK